MNRIKLILSIIILLFSLAVVLPNFLNSSQFLFFNKKINLGLDLRGGSYLLLEIDFPKFFEEKIADTKEEIRKILKEGNINFTNITQKNENLIVTFKDINSLNLATNSIKELFNEFLALEIHGTNLHIHYTPFNVTQIKRQVLNESLLTVRRRIDELGTREAIIQAQGDNKILLQVPGLENPTQLKTILGKTAKLHFHLIAEKNEIGTLWLKDSKGYTYPLQRKIELTGDLLKDAFVTFADRGKPAISIRFNAIGAKKFAKLTKENTQKPLVIVLDDIVLTAPLISQAIVGGQAEINGSFTLQSAQELALLLRSGALIAPLSIVQEKVIGPSLGADSIIASKKAAGWALFFISLVMILIYDVLGLCASIALIFNMLLILAIFITLQITLTLPGIAGLILTMGMAVDTNVLIFERIREEVKHENNALKILKNSFRSAKNTVIDSNLTTLIAALIMFVTGQGPIKGFALTLSIGIISSLFTAITITYILIFYWLKFSKTKHFSFTN